MSILIKGLKMPKEYEFIDLVITGDGVVREYYTDKVDIAVAEAVELPDHGDLIDRDALMAHTGSAYDIDGHELYAVGTGTILRMPVVIPAERTADLCDACGKADKENCSYCDKMERNEEECEDEGEDWYTELDDPKFAERDEDGQT